MSSTSQSAAVLSFEDARRVVEEQARQLRPVDTERRELLHAQGMVLAEEIAADRAFPPFARATRDGFAVRSAEVATPPARLRVVAEIRAGSSLGRALQPGEAAEIMTGAPAPEGADAVVMVEHTSRRGAEVEIKRTVAAGENIVPAGSEARRGQALLAQGMRLAFPQIAVAAAAGKADVRVYKRPRVAILATGDEIVDVAAAPGPHQIRNSNSYSLAAQAHSAGGEAVQLPIAPDDAVQLRHLIAEGLTADLLLISGGVSMGKHDLVEETLQHFDAQFLFTGALIQPGRPVVFGHARGAEGSRPFFGLPGNPVSTMVTFQVFVRPVLDALAGAPPTKLLFVQARLKKDFKTRTGLRRFLPAIYSADSAEVEVVPWQGSGDIVSCARANSYLAVPPDRDRLAAG